MFRRIMVANRGEIAHRIIRTLKQMGIEPVAIFSEPDKAESYLEDVAEAVCIGPALAKDSYLNQDAILQAALQTGCEAIHPGFGFLAENALFAKRCEAQKLSFIGPSARLISLMGDKAQAISSMQALGLPTLAGSAGVVTSFEEASALTENLGYPVLLKARSGGGGKGMRLVNSSQELAELMQSAQREAQSAFGDGALYVEKFIKNARHIELQILADHFGNVLCLGERECSIQRRNQKLIEEAPANGFSEAQRDKIIETIVPAIKKLGYTNAGTLEFLMDQSGQLYFMEMNTRIQVEHGVSELICGLDIVEWQIRIAANEKLPFLQENFSFAGHAIEVRINAEDPRDNFSPSPGLVKQLKWPKNHFQGPIRIDSHIRELSKISPFYDSMVAKVLSKGENRQVALKNLKEALAEVEIVGVKTNLDLQKKIIASKEFSDGDYDCSFLENNLESFL